MGNTKIVAGLSVSSIRQAQDAVKRYQGLLIYRCGELVNALADLGIQTAWARIGSADKGFGKYITFQKNVSGLVTRTGVECILVASNTGLITNRWYQADGSIKSADISPILMLEFGAGPIAGNPDAIKFHMGQGTFPGQTHAHDANGWWYKNTKDDTWYHSYGYKASMPMQSAANKMISDIRQVARQVFG